MSPSLAQALMLRKSDQALCAAVRDGHEAAFAAIVLRYRSQLLRHCRSLLPGAHAEDAVQQTFVRALQALRSGTEVRELAPWLHRIARNVALTELSGRHRDHTELSEEWEDRGRAGELERRAELREALMAIEALPDRQRTALVRSVSGDSPSTIADQLGLSAVAMRQLLHRARVSVRAAVNALAPPPLIWLSRRVVTACDKVPRAAGVPAGAAPVVSKIAVVVVASATVAAPATVIHAVLTHHHRARRTHHVLVAHPAPDPPLAAPAVVAAAPPPRPAIPVRLAAPAPLHRHRSRPKVAHAAHATDPAPPPQQAAASAPGPASVAAGSAAQAPATSSPALASASGPSGASASGPSATGPVATASASGPTGGPAGPSGP